MKRFVPALFVIWSTAWAGVVHAMPPLERPYRAVDGDTVAVGPLPCSQTICYRLIGFDTPETGHALCVEERRHGVIAKARLQQLMDRGRVRIIPKFGPRTGRISKDKYGRVLAYMYIDDEGVAEIMIREGLAVAYTARVKRTANHNWCKSLRAARGENS
jgi:endonuclease YncB( thermonuclease family)